MKKIYLDHNATTPIRAVALAAVTASMADVGNASSAHGFGRDARKLVETARRQIADTLDVSPGQVTFNSGATEGNNTVLKGFAGQRILISAIEHPSVINSGVPAEIIPVTVDGVVDMEAFAALLAKGPPPALVSVMLVNNETGVIQPVAEIARLAKAAGAKIHADCTQAYGRIPFTRESLGVDMLTLSSHKIGGPQGVGCIVLAPGLTLPKLLEGGGQEKRQRAGTENVAGIAGFGAAAVECVTRMKDFQNLSILQDRIETHMQNNHVRVLGKGAARVANTTLLTVEGATGETLLMAFDLEGVAISTGSACSSGSTQMSHVLAAMGISDVKDRAAIRISLGHTTTAKDIDDFLAVWDRIAARLLKD